MDTTAELLETSTYRDLKVVDIARRAGTSPATFYQYFADVEEAVLALAEEMESEAGPRLAALIDDHPWAGPEGLATALAVARGFFDLWEQHRSVLRVIDLASYEGDLRFRDLRTRLLGEASGAFVRVLCEQGGDADDPEILAQAGVLVSMLAHVSAHREGLEHWGAGSADLRRSLASILYTTMSGQVPPSEG